MSKTKLKKKGKKSKGIFVSEKELRKLESILFALKSNVNKLKTISNTPTQLNNDL